MAFQVPKLSRSEPTQTASVGRTNVDVPNFAAATAPQREATGNLVESGANNYVKYVNEIADTESLKASTELEHFLHDSLEGDNGVKRKKGNPYELYNQLDQSEEAKFNEIRERYADASSETKAAVERKLLESRGKFYERKTSARGLQIDAYETSIHDDAVELKKNDLMGAAAIVDVNDKSSLAQFDNVIREIYDIRVKRALKNESGKEVKQLDVNGNEIVSYDLNPSVKLQIAKDTSDGIYQAIENLANSGKVKEAQFMSERYGVYLDALNKNKVAKTIEREGVDYQASALVDQYSNLPYDKGLKAIEAQKDKLGYKVVEKARLKLDTRRKQIENAEKTVEEDNYKSAMKAVANGKFLTADQMRSDEKIKQIWNRIDPKHQIALEEMVEQPKTSNVTVKSKLFQKLQDGEFAGMSYETLATEMQGLSKRDRTMFENQHLQANTDTAGEESSKIRFMYKEVQEALFTRGYVDRNDFLKFEDGAQRKINEAKEEFFNYMQTLPKGLSHTELKKEIMQYADKKAAGKAFGKDKPSGDDSPAPKQPTFEGTTKPDVSAVPGVVRTGTAKMTFRDAKKAIWEKSNVDPAKRVWPSDAEVEKYLQGK